MTQFGISRFKSVLGLTRIRTEQPSKPSGLSVYGEPTLRFLRGIQQTHILGLTLLVLLTALSACGRPPALGLTGEYLEGKREVMRGRGANLDLAIGSLEAVVKQDPLYQDSLTLLGRAYYQRARYTDAFAILQRAVAVNQDDEIAWTVLGLSQMRMGYDEKGLETLKGGLTLLSRASKDGYKGIEFWDRNRHVASALRRTVFLATKGLEDRENLIAQTETLLQRIDDEEWRARREQTWEEPAV
jgi:tetratricopeptide (TPR) repeat protein